MSRSASIYTDQIRVPKSRVVVGAFAAFLLGLVGFGIATNSSVSPLYDRILTTVPVGVVPVVVVALCEIPLIRYLEKLGIPLIVQAVVCAMGSVIVIGALAGLVFAISGVGLPAFMAAPIAGWCGFFGVLISRALHMSRGLFVAALAVSLACIVSGCVLLAIPFAS